MRTIKISDSFVNIRGAFRIGGVINIGTHASLVRLASGRHVFLDSLTLTPKVLAEVHALTDNGASVEAVLNLHPFHTVHVEAMQAAFPAARHYGTKRHVERFPHLDWQPQLSESPELHDMFAEDFSFSVPRGVDFISPNPHLHFSSVLALHRASNTIHVDDTLMYTRLPAGLGDRVSLHMTLSRVLEKRAGAVADFRQWADTLIEDWQEARNLCTAHTHALLGQDAGVIAKRVRGAVARVERTLSRHQSRHG